MTSASARDPVASQQPAGPVDLAVCERRRRPLASRRAWRVHGEAGCSDMTKTPDRETIGPVRTLRARGRRRPAPLRDAVRRRFPTDRLHGASQLRSSARRTAGTVLRPDRRARDAGRHRPSAPSGAAHDRPIVLCSGRWCNACGGRRGRLGLAAAPISDATVRAPRPEGSDVAATRRASTGDEESAICEAAERQGGWIPGRGRGIRPRRRRPRVD